MLTDERFSKFLFGSLLIISFFVSWGQWLALLLGVLFITSSIYEFCISCQFKRLFHPTNKEKQSKQ